MTYLERKNNSIMPKVRIYDKVAHLISADLSGTLAGNKAALTAILLKNLFDIILLTKQSRNLQRV